MGRFERADARAPGLVRERERRRDHRRDRAPRHHSVGVRLEAQVGTHGRRPEHQYAVRVLAVAGQPHVVAGHDDGALVGLRRVEVRHHETAATPAMRVGGLDQHRLELRSREPRVVVTDESVEH